MYEKLIIVRNKVDRIALLNGYLVNELLMNLFVVRVVLDVSFNNVAKPYLQFLASAHGENYTHYQLIKTVI